jgi:hypothetical protein
MIIIWGIRSMRRSMGVVLAMCHNCSRPCAQSIFVIRRWFTLFFIPLFPVGTKYVGVCSLCASATRMDREPAERLEQEGNRQRQQPVEYTPDGPLTPFGSGSAFATPGPSSAQALRTGGRQGPFCGSCGSSAGPEDVFCAECGTPRASTSSGIS